jgi:hypothetical protein
MPALVRGRRLLYDVLRFVLVAQKPASQVVGGVEMRKHRCLEFRPFLRSEQ